MIDEKKLIEEIKSLQVTVNGLRAGKGILREFEKQYRESILRIIEEQPKVGEWIPCSERLPEMHREDMEAEGEYYMISNPVIVTDGKQIYIAEYEEDIDYRYGWHGFDGEDYDNIIAWMPLPEPYQPEKESE